MAFEKFHDLVHDIKHSWYFRIWGVLWIVCASVAFAGLIVLSRSAEKNQTEQGFRVWTDFPSQLLFPNFYVHLLPGEGADEQISQISCTYGPQNVSLSIGNCQFQSGPELCSMVIANTTMAIAPQDNNGNADPLHGSDSIFCAIWTTYNTTANNNTFNTVMGVSIHHTRVPLYIMPDQVANVRIEMETVQYWGASSEETRYTAVTGVSSNYVPEGARFGLSVRYNDFRVTHYQKTDLFNGWMGVGAIGGVAFFLYVLHTFVMGIIGCFIPNTSKFLGGANSVTRAGYNDL